MAHAVWSGSLSFGLVSLPVSLLTATESHTVHFHQIERGTSDRVRIRRVNESSGDEVPYDRIVKGYPAGDAYVIVEPEELDEITPGRSRTIDITGFASLDDIEPVYFDTTYYVAPRNKTHAKVYGLLHAALDEAGRAGIATMTMRQKEYLVALHAQGGVLVLHTLHWADEVRDPRRTLDNLPAGRPDAQELRTAVQLIEAMAIDWDPHDYRDITQERVRELIEAKQSGATVPQGAPEPESTEPVNLMEALRASVDRAQGGSSADRSRQGTEAEQGKRDKRGKQGGGRARGRGGRGEQGAKAEQGERGRGGAGTRGRKRDAKASAGDDLDRLSKAELYERAGEAGISGRSKMNRGELQRALTESEPEAGSGTGRRARKAS